MKLIETIVLFSLFVDKDYDEIEEIDK